MIANLPTICRCGCRRLKWIVMPVTGERRWCCARCGDVLYREPAK